MTRLPPPSDALRTPVLVWLSCCAVGEAGGLEASAAVAAALGHAQGGPEALIWLAFAGAFEGFVLASFQWVALRRIGVELGFWPFCLATMAAATTAFTILHGARLAFGDGWATVGLMLCVGALCGALVGASQAIALSRLGARPLPWIVGCALGWTAVVAVATLAWPLLTLVEGIGMSALAGAGVGLLGGGLLGLFTSSPLLEIRRQLAR
ncbi:MAG: hypothetical protein ACOYKM_13545 [Caulobacterales bacterium]